MPTPTSRSSAFSFPKTDPENSSTQRCGPQALWTASRFAAPTGSHYSMTHEGRSGSTRFACSLGAEDFSKAEMALVETPAQRDGLAKHIPVSLSSIYRYWLPFRQAMHELQPAKIITRAHPKVGRNDPCPCGSGKKFKKCCGVAPTVR